MKFISSLNPNSLLIILIIFIVKVVKVFNIFYFYTYKIDFCSLILLAPQHRKTVLKNPFMDYRFAFSHQHQNRPTWLPISHKARMGRSLNINRLNHSPIKNLNLSLLIFFTPAPVCLIIFKNEVIRSSLIGPIVTSPWLATA